MRLVQFILFIMDASFYKLYYDLLMYENVDPQVARKGLIICYLVREQIVRALFDDGFPCDQKQLIAATCSVLINLQIIPSANLISHQ